MVVTPAYEDTLEKLISGAAKLQPPHFPDAANQEAEAQILTLQGTRHVTSKIDGDRKLSDVSCSCGVPMVKGSPCLHTAKHALAVGRGFWFVTFVTEVSLYSPRRKPEKTLSDYFIGRFAILFSDFFSFPPSTGLSEYCVRVDASGSGSAQNLVRRALPSSFDVFLGFLPCHKINRSYGKARTET